MPFLVNHKHMGRGMEKCSIEDLFDMIELILMMAADRYEGDIWEIERVEDLLDELREKVLGVIDGKV